jgi:hypothetical protein
MLSDPKQFYKSHCNVYQGGSVQELVRDKTARDAFLSGSRVRTRTILEPMHMLCSGFLEPLFLVDLLFSRRNFKEKIKIISAMDKVNT